MVKKEERCLVNKRGQKAQVPTYVPSCTLNKRGQKAQILTPVPSCTLNKRGQITIFMILGLMLLFVFVFLIQLNSSIQETQLADAKESIYTKAFKKEAMRIFVEDCLNDHLEEALITIGKQGRLWSDQPGGVKGFEEGLTGVTYESASGEERVYYGIVNDEYLNQTYAYPCDNESESPHFCQYEYPNTKLGYGDLELKTGTIISDLRRRLIDRTVWCVESFTKSNISSKAEIETTTMDLKLELLDEGIDVEVIYPFKFKIGGEEFFHLSNFDFFYPTRFKELLDAAVTFPLEQDQKYLDFAYNETTLTSSVFQYGSLSGYTSCSLTNITSPWKEYYLCNRSTHLDKYKGLGIEMIKEQINDLGDDIFIFKPALYSIITSPDQYVFQIARQNRPPALDYIHREECVGAGSSGYDYLVIKNESDELGTINITAFALDPDEDNVEYNLDSVEGVNSESDKENVFYLSNSSISSLGSDIHELLVRVRDEHHLEDQQNVRVLVDRPLEVDVEVDIPYQFKTSTGGIISYAELFANDSYQVSTEDPVFVSIKTPEESEVSVSPIATLIYNSSTSNESFNYNLPTGTSTDGDELNVGGTVGCVSFPWLPTGECGLDQYSETDLDNWKSQLTSQDDSHFSEVGNGVLNISFSATYCGGNVQGNYKEVEIGVKECVPHYNPERPFAYPYHGYKFGLLSDGTTNLSDFMGDDTSGVNLFNATHSCCTYNDLDPKGGWSIKSNTSVCFTNPEYGCYGEFVPGTHILEEEVGYCDGERGNICGGELEYVSVSNKLICGDDTQPNCEGVEDACQGGLAYSALDTDEDGENDRMCGGTVGCGPLANYIVYLGDEDLNYISLEYVNQQAKSVWENSNNDLNQFVGNFDFSFTCSGNDGKPCSTSFDGYFEKYCVSGSCVDVICAPGALRCSEFFNSIEKCNSEGTEYSPYQGCPRGHFCASGECVPQYCTPGESYCYDELSDELIEEIRSSELFQTYVTHINPDFEDYDTSNVLFICNSEGSMYTAEECIMPRACEDGRCSYN